jgi:hypothetical protein
MSNKEIKVLMQKRKKGSRYMVTGLLPEALFLKFQEEVQNSYGRSESSLIAQIIAEHFQKYPLPKQDPKEYMLDGPVRPKYGKKAGKHG